MLFFFQTNRSPFMCLQTYREYLIRRWRKTPWTAVEDETLRKLVASMRIGNYIPFKKSEESYLTAYSESACDCPLIGFDFVSVARHVHGRDVRQVIYRWSRVLSPTLKKGPWTKEEDEVSLARGVTRFVYWTGNNSRVRIRRY